MRAKEAYLQRHSLLCSKELGGRYDIVDRSEDFICNHL